MENIPATGTSGEGTSQSPQGESQSHPHPLPLRQRRKPIDKHHSDKQQPHHQPQERQQLPFPIRIASPHEQRRSPGPRSPTDSYNEMRRWAAWKPLDRAGSKTFCGNWHGDWVNPPTSEDAGRLVRELVAWAILPDCFFIDVKEEASRIPRFANGSHNCLFNLRCRCGEGVASASGTGWRHQIQNVVGPGLVDDTYQRSFPCSNLPHEVLLRLSIPTDPYFKTESEVATTHFARTQGLLVPEIYLYDSSARNCLGLEWQIVQKMASCCNIEDWKEAANSSLGPREKEEQMIESSQPWADFGICLSESIRALRSRAFDNIGSLYWDHEARDFTLGPVSNPFFVAARRLLYCGDDDFQRSHRGPFRTVEEFLKSYLAIWSHEAADKALRCDIGPPISPTDDKIHENQDEGSKTARESKGSRGWYQQVDVDRIHEQLSKLRDTIIPYLISHLPASQDQTYVSHPDLHYMNVLVDCLPAGWIERSHPAQHQSEHGIPEVKIAAIIDWEHTVALPDYLIDPARVQMQFFGTLPHVRAPVAKKIHPLEWLLGESGDGGRGLQSCLPFPPSLPPEELPREIIYAFPPDAVETEDIWGCCECLCEVFAPCNDGNGVAVPRTKLQLLLHHIFSNVDFYAREDCSWINGLAGRIDDLLAAERRCR